jgi:hypothetical protein
LSSGQRRTIPDDIGQEPDKKMTTTTAVVRDRDNCSVCGYTRRVLKAGVMGQHSNHAGRCPGSKQAPADWAPVIYDVSFAGGKPGSWVEHRVDIHCSRGDLDSFLWSLYAECRRAIRSSREWNSRGSLLGGSVWEVTDGAGGGAHFQYSATARETDIPRGPLQGGPWQGRVHPLSPSEPWAITQFGRRLGFYERDGEAWKWVPVS